MVKLCLKGRTGNQLFQFAYAYLLSKNKNTGIAVKPTSYFGYRLEMFSLPLFLDFLPKSIFVRAQRLFFNLYKTQSVITENSCFYSFHLPNVEGNVEVDGFFQDGSALSKHRNELLHVFKIKRKYTNRFQLKYEHLLKQKNLVLNIRMADDYKVAYFDEIQSKGILPIEWYLSVLEKIDFSSFDNLIVVSDSIEEAKTIKELEKYNPVFIKDDMYTDFLFLTHADCLIIPNSSFSWWGAFLNQRNGRKIYAPKNWVGNHAGVEYPTGIMTDEFEWI
jgi:hypothetical protein